MRFLEKENLNNILIGIVIFLQVITISLVVLCSDCYDKDTKDEEKTEVIALEKENSKDQKGTLEEVSSISKVDIKGAVKNPGVYDLESNSRVIDVINLAGGLKSNASTKYLNLSKRISDEMIIYVYTANQVNKMSVVEEIKEECSCPVIDTSSCAGSSIIVTDNNSSDNISSLDKDNEVEDKKISINNGTKEELMTLSGIGESKANAIIEYRNKNNGFKTLEELMNVSGIGEAAYNKIKDFIEL